MRPSGDSLPLEPQLAACGRYVATEQMGEGGFARAIGADHGMDLVFVQRQRHIIDSQQAAEALRQLLGF